MRSGRTLLAAVALAGQAVVLQGQQAHGSLTANGKTAKITWAAAYEVDSTSEPGYLDVLVVLADRELPREVALDEEQMEAMTRDEGLAGLRLLLDPDAKVKSAEPLHPAFTTIVSSGVFVQWEPSAYDETTVAGHVYTGGEQEAFGQRWQYDLTFTAPIALDPEASTVPGSGSE